MFSENITYTERNDRFTLLGLRYSMTSI